nr:phage major tail protein 2 [uncultured Mediterranean phage uvMED]
MPIACSQSVLTGSDGSVWYTPAATKWCLKDFTDFPAGTDITVPSDHDFRVGDPVVFIEEDGGKLDSALSPTTIEPAPPSTTYYVLSTTATTITISSIKGDATSTITLTGDGGTGSADSLVGHIKIRYGPAEAICQVRSWDLTIERETLDVTTLPCGIKEVGAGGKYASFRKMQPGYATGTGSMEIFFTDDDLSISNRMLDNIMLRSQEGAAVRLFVDTKQGGGTPAQVDLTNSSYIEAEIRMSSMQVGQNPDDPTAATVDFQIVEPRRLFKTDLD